MSRTARAMDVDFFFQKNDLLVKFSSSFIIERVIAGDYMHRVQGGKTVASVKKDSREAKNFIKETEKQITDLTVRRGNKASYLNDRKASANMNYNK